MTGRLREELSRIGDAAPVAQVDPDTWGRARRARTRDRVLAGAAVVAVLALVGGLAGLLPDRSPTPVAGARGAVPDHIYAVTSTRDVPVTSDLAVGRTAAAYVTTIGASARVVTIGATDGTYHVLDLPRFADSDLASPASIALSPDGMQLAYAWAGKPASRGSAPVPTGVAVVDLRSNRTSSFRLSGGTGILVRTISWSPDGRWLVWDGQVSTLWSARERRFGGEMAAGRIDPRDDRSESVPASASTRATESFGIDDSGSVTITSRSQLVVWDGTVVEQTRTPRGSGLPMEIAHAGNPVADLRSAVAGQRRTVFHILRWSGGDESPTLATPDAGGVALGVRGWLGDTPVVEAQPLSGAWATTSLNLLTDSGLREIGRLDSGVQDLTLATDLMTASQPTVDVPAPDWVPQDGTPWVWIGLGVGVVVLLGAGVLVVRRRLPR